MSILRRHTNSVGALLLILWLTLNASAQLSREADYLRRASDRFRIVYCPEDTDLVDPLFAELQQRIPQAERLFGAQLSDTITFVVTPTELEWGRVTGGAPLWANGLAFPSRATAILKSPRFGSPYGPLPTTAVHEYVHILISAVTQDRGVPRWFDEGISQLAAGQINYMDQQIVARAAATKRLHSFQNLQGLMGMSALEAQQGYAESILAAQLLQSRFGWSGISNLLHTIRSGTDFEQSFARVFGISLSQFEREFRADIESNYGVALLSDTELWVSALFVVLVFGAGITVYLRRRRTLERWTDDEQHTPNPENLSVAPPFTVNYELLRSRGEEHENFRESEKSGEDSQPEDTPPTDSRPTGPTGHN